MSLWDRIGAIGARPDDRPDEHRRLVLTNQGAVLGALSCLLFGTGFALYAPCLRVLAEANAIVIVFDFVALALNRRGLRTLAKASVLVPTHGLIVVAGIDAGLDAGFHYYFFLLVTFSYLLFGHRERLLRAAFVALSIACAIVVGHEAPLGSVHPELSPMVVRDVGVASGVLVILTLVLVVEIFASDTVRAEERLAEEHGRSERLLLNILPAPISARLKANEEAIADGFADVTVLFADLVGFTELSQELTPRALVAMLNRVFSSFDDLAEELGMEKIKTIGDCYMVVAGLPEPRPDHVEVTARMALGIRSALDRVNKEAGFGLRLRIGIHTGPVIAGVIGKRKFIYDVWGDTVNTASRMESSGSPDEIQVTQAVHDRLVGSFSFTSRGRIKAKGLGEMETYFLTGEISAPPIDASAASRQTHSS